MENVITEQRLPGEALPHEDLKAFFITHLNRIYCAKSQLVEKLPELVKRSHFLDLKQAIEETVEIVENQIKRMKEIFIMLDAYYTYESCTGLIGILDEAFQSIGPQAKNPTLRDLSILFYMQNIESIEMASFKIMMMVADKMNKPDVEQLLKECYDEAKDDRILLKQISENYI